MAYRYDRSALKRLRKGYKLKCVLIYEKLGIPQGCYMSWEDGATPKLKELIAISNFFRVSISAFFEYDDDYDDSEKVLPERAPVKGFVPTTFYRGVMRDYIISSTKLPLTTIIRKLHSSHRSWNNMFPASDYDDSTLTTDKFLHICNTFKIWPGSFFTALGENIPCIEGYKKAMVVKELGDMRIMNEIEKKASMLDDVIESQEPLAALKKQYEEQLEQNTQLHKEKYARTVARMKKDVDNLKTQLKEKDDLIADLRQQLVEARSYAMRLSGGYTALAAEEDMA